MICKEEEEKNSIVYCIRPSFMAMFLAMKSKNIMLVHNLYLSLCLMAIINDNTNQASGIVSELGHKIG
jgi:hypothetical protein